MFYCAGRVQQQQGIDQAGSPLLAGGVSLLLQACAALRALSSSITMLGSAPSPVTPRRVPGAARQRADGR